MVIQPEHSVQADANGMLTNGLAGSYVVKAATDRTSRQLDWQPETSTSPPGFNTMKDMRYRYLILAILSLSLAAIAAQNQPPVERVPVGKSAPKPADNAAQPPHSDDDTARESSSKTTQIDVAPSRNDEKDHPHSYEVETDSDISEFHPYDPHKAMKAIEVGDFYFKKENYKAAISRYQEALEWKPNDAEATYKLGEALEKSGDLSGAVESYQAYLKILPHGPYAEKANKALERLKEKGFSSSAKATPKPN